MIFDKLKGCGVATITPFRNGDVDYEAIESVIEFQIKGGVDYFVFLGTTAETSTLSEKEEQLIINKTKEVNQGRVPLVLGNFGGNNTQALLSKFDRFDLNGVDAILSVSPYYNKPSQEGIFAHYTALAERTPVPIIMYNVPGRTASLVSTDTILRLADTQDMIAGVKDATGNMVEATRIAKLAASDFLVLSGDDPTALPFMSCGGHGVISVIANAYPAAFAKMINYCLAGDYQAAIEIHSRLIDLHYWLYVEGNPVGVKSCMEIMGLCTGEVRLPLVRASVQTVKGLENEMDSIEKAMR
jgi:4-hydroxy-tetrahydrodipicolinate synthase